MVGKYPFHIQTKIADQEWCYADNYFGWLRVFCILIIATVTTIIWSIFDRKRKEYACLQEWFRLFLRLVIAKALINYGMSKVIPVQFPPINLTDLELKLGDTTPMGLMWRFMGFSPAYSIFCGFAEIVPAVLLMSSRFTLLGALITAAVMLNVFMLNVCYGVHVKLYSLHLILMALVLIAPDTARLVCFFTSSTAMTPRLVPSFFKHRRLNQLILTLPFVLGAYLFWVSYSGDMFRFKTITAEPPYFGIWDVTQFTHDGKSSAEEEANWKKVIIQDNYSVRILYPQTDSYNTFYSVLDKNQRSLTFGDIENWDEVRKRKYSWSRFPKPLIPKWTQKFDFEIEQLGSDTLRLRGHDPHAKVIEVILHRENLKERPLYSYKFKWITNFE
jgi:hypothetical protein